MTLTTGPGQTPEAWKWLLGVVALFAALATLAPMPLWARDGFYLGTEALVAAGGLWAIIRNRPTGKLRRAWVLLNAGLFGYLAADGLWIYYARVGRDPYPSPADVLFIVSTLMMIMGATLIARARRHVITDNAATKDTAVLGGAVATLLWVFVVQPSIELDAATPLELALGFAYPGMSIVLALVVTRLVIAGGRISRSLQLLLAGLIMLVGAETAYYVQGLTDTYVEWGVVDAAYMISFGLLGAAMLHPSMTSVADIPKTRPLLNRSRLVLLCVGASTPLLLIFVRADSAGLVLGLASVAVTLYTIVIVRSWALVDTVRDLTRRQDDQRFSALVQHSADAIVVVDSEGHIKTASDTLTRTWRANTTDGAGREPRIDDWIDQTDRRTFRSFREGVAQLDPGESDRIRVRMTRGEDWGYAEVVGANLLHNPDIAGVVLTVRDISNRVALELELRRQAEHDGLTGLANRALFSQSLERELAEPGNDNPALLLLDVDEFKRINDELGHLIGDAVLVEFSRRLNQVLPPFALAARLGGDEFAVLVPAASSVGSIGALAQQISTAVCPPIEADQQTVSITTSIGIAVADQGQDGETLVRQADAAMYAAKADGRGRIQHYSTSLAEQVETELSLRRGLAQARKAEELRVVYQTIVDASSGEPTMVEALLRWDHPERGTITPDVFIPIADSSGIIDDIGMWALQQACQVGAQLAPGVRTAVNVSLRQLRSSSFMTEVIRALKDADLPPTFLVLEIGQDALAEPQVKSRLDQLRRYGVKIALEKFGSNYATLTRLSQLDVDIIKIDQHLMDDEHISPVLVDAILRQADEAGIEVVIQGVETDDMRHHVEDMGASGIQGFAIGRPVDGRAVLDQQQRRVEDHVDGPPPFTAA